MTQYNISYNLMFWSAGEHKGQDIAPPDIALFYLSVGDHPRYLCKLNSVLFACPDYVYLHADIRVRDIFARRSRLAANSSGYSAEGGAVDRGCSGLG